MARSVRITVTVPPDVAERLEKIAKKEKRTLSNMTAISIEKFCDLYDRQQQRKKAKPKAEES